MNWTDDLMGWRGFWRALTTPIEQQLAEHRSKQMNMECRTGQCGHNHDPKPAGFHLSPNAEGVCRFEQDPEAIAAIRHAARLLRQAKIAHTEWESRFEGPVPAHDWEVWYAQWMLAQNVRQTQTPVVPCSITKLGALVGPLD